MIPNWYAVMCRRISMRQGDGVLHIFKEKYFNTKRGHEHSAPAFFFLFYTNVNPWRRESRKFSKALSLFYLLSEEMNTSTDNGGALWEKKTTPQGFRVRKYVWTFSLCFRVDLFPPFSHGNTVSPRTSIGSCDSDVRAMQKPLNKSFNFPFRLEIWFTSR